MPDMFSSLQRNMLDAVKLAETVKLYAFRVRSDVQKGTLVDIQADLHDMAGAARKLADLVETCAAATDHVEPGPQA